MWPQHLEVRSHQALFMLCVRPWAVPGALLFSEAGESSFRAFLTQILSRFYDPMPGSRPSAWLGSKMVEKQVDPNSWQTFGQNKGMAVPHPSLL